MKRGSGNRQGGVDRDRASWRSESIILRFSRLVFFGARTKGYHPSASKPTSTTFIISNLPLADVKQDK